jgi:glycosyltransferase involved in cell wall biosynthesis
MKTKSKISIITVVYNGERFLEGGIQSVVNQACHDIEYIIIDGGSVDGSVDIIKKYANDISYWVSESDDGIYDAMNKGIEKSTGSYVFFMGADDILIAKSISKLLNKMDGNTEKLIALPVAINDVDLLSYPDITLPVPVLHHQGAVFNLECLKKIGSYSDKYIVHSDFDLMCKYGSKYGIQYLDNPICMFRKGGASTSGANAVRSMKELLYIYFVNSGKIFSTKWMMFIVRPLYYFVCAIMRK